MWTVDELISILKALELKENIKKENIKICNIQFNNNDHANTVTIKYSCDNNKKANTIRIIKGYNSSSIVEGII